MFLTASLRGLSRHQVRNIEYEIRETLGTTTIGLLYFAVLDIFHLLTPGTDILTIAKNFARMNFLLVMILNDRDWQIK